MLISNSMLLANYVLDPQMVAFQFGDVSTKIENRHVFDVPSYCTTVEPKKEKRVCGPAQFEADAVGKLAQVYKGEPMVFPIHLRQSRDHTNKVEAVESTITTAGDTTIKSKTIIHWDEVLYRHCSLYLL